MEYLVVAVSADGYYAADGDWRSIQELGQSNWSLVTIVPDKGGTLYAWFSRKHPKQKLSSTGDINW